MNRPALILAASLAVLAGAAAKAHHSFAVYFDGDKIIKLEGTVKSFRFTNPHGLLVIDVVDDRGPAVRITKPGHDTRPTTVEEVFVEASAEDDFGVARLELDLEGYRTRLEARLGRRREVMRDIMLMAQRNPRRIVYPEGEDDRIIRAVAQARNEGIVKPVLLGRPDRIRKRAEDLHIDLTGIEVVDPRADDARSERYAQRFYERIGFRFVEDRRFGDDECAVYRLDRGDWQA